jgi:hypothetical protein
MKLWPWFVAVACSVGCGVELEQVTEAPPGKAASISAENIELSRGIAIAVHCLDGCDGSCKSPQVRSLAAEVVEVRRISDDPPVDTGGLSDAAALFLLVGRGQGQTDLTVDSDCGSTTYHVDVIE